MPDKKPDINQDPPNVPGASTPTDDHPDGKLDGNPLAIGEAPSVDRTPGPQGRADNVSPAFDPKAAEKLKAAAAGQQEPKPSDIVTSEHMDAPVKEAEKTPEQKAAVIRATQLELDAQRAQSAGASQISAAQKMSEASVAWAAAGEKERSEVAAKIARQYSGQPEPAGAMTAEQKVGLQDPTR